MVVTSSNQWVEKAHLFSICFNEVTMYIYILFIYIYIFFYFYINIPYGSMYGMVTYIYHTNQLNVGK